MYNDTFNIDSFNMIDFCRIANNIVNLLPRVAAGKPIRYVEGFHVLNIHIPMTLAG